MADRSNNCPDCDALSSDDNLQPARLDVDRRGFLKTAGFTAAALSTSLPAWSRAEDAKPAGTPETAVGRLFDTLSDKQKQAVCFAWDYQDPKRGLLRTRVSNNWHITEPEIASDFYTKEQQAIIREIWEGLYNPDWIKRIEQQLEDDAGGYGREQSLAIFGKPGEKFELVMTGRHMTIRCDGNSTEHVAFGGPIFYGHAASGFNEDAGHPGNVYWPQAVAANKLYQTLDGKQQKLALLEKMPQESRVGFRGNSGGFQGIPVTELSADQKKNLQEVLGLLVEPYRKSDQDEALECLKKQGGLDACSLAFFSQGDLGNDKVWDNWRLEGPSFVWHFRGTPHVHVWVNIADDPKVELNAQG